jgi:predicted ATPase/class 3 adenylate cyclase/DNA-binding CsgD family transcriptional regulator
VPPSGSATIRAVRSASLLPTGTVTFVLADVEGSVALWESQGAEMAAATRKLDSIVAQLIERHHGARPIEQGEGDSFVAAFAIARHAMLFAVELQTRLAREPWASALPLRTRLALHTGAAQLRDDDNYMGPSINRCARLRGLAHGGQVLLSGATAGLVVDDLPEGVSLRDLGSHKLRDFARPEQVFQVVHGDLPDTFPPLRDEAVDSNLPASLTTFVAREAELATLGRMLHENRLVTLTGAGGCGKTRLAIEFARRVAPRFPDGVAWADAAPIGDEDLVISCVAAAVEIKESAFEPLIDTVARELADRDVLILIDNCEHVIDAAAAVVERILNASERVRVIATSREPLGVAGEIALRVPSLDGDASIRLFEDRARTVVPDLPWDRDAQRYVADICSRLDGIPLAIELAAARTRVLTTRQIADGIADRFALLSGGARTALPRQRTLEASVEWSYRLLSDGEAVLLNRLSVFAGGFGLEAVRRVCADETIDEAAVLDLLTALVDKSLVQVNAAAGERAELRYWTLETIRHFARQRLADSPDAERTRDRHLSYFLEFAERTAPEIEGGKTGDLAALARLEGDLDNFRAAREWAHQRGEADRLLRLMGALALFHELRCDFDEAVTWLRIALDAAPSPTPARALALWGLGDISIFTAGVPAVAAAGEEIVAIGESLEDPGVLLRGRLLLGWAAAFGGYREPEWGVEVLSEIVATLQEEDPSWLETDAAIALVTAAMLAGDLAKAIEAGHLAVASAQRNASAAALQRAKYYLGLPLAQAGYVREAEPLLQEVIALADDLNESTFKAFGRGTLANVYWRQGRLEEAAVSAREALTIAQRSGDPFTFGSATISLAQALADRGEEAAAAALLDDLNEVLDPYMVWFFAAASAGVRVTTLAAEDLDAARAHLASVYSAVAPAGQGPILLWSGWVERLAGDEAAAEAAFTAAVEASARTRAPGDLAAALHELGVCAGARDQFERAVRLCAAADAARAEIGIEPSPRLRALGPRAADYDLLRSKMGDEVFTAEWAAGSDMSLEQATHFALRGKGGRRRPTTGWESLTPTEQEVVRYVTEGLSNPAIAERMLVTRGTVKVHLSHVFTKLGVASRAELAAEAARRAEAL